VFRAAAGPPQGAAPDPNAAVDQAASEVKTVGDKLEGADALEQAMARAKAKLDQAGVTGALETKVENGNEVVIQAEAQAPASPSASAAPQTAPSPAAAASQAAPNPAAQAAPKVKKPIHKASFFLKWDVDFAANAGKSGVQKAMLLARVDGQELFSKIRSGDGEHAEEKFIEKLQSTWPQLIAPPTPKFEKGKPQTLTVTINRSPCGPTGHDCAKALSDLATGFLASKKPDYNISLAVESLSFYGKSNAEVLASRDALQMMLKAGIDLKPTTIADLKGRKLLEAELGAEVEAELQRRIDVMNAELERAKGIKK
jgi:hypothetical protein